MFSVFDRRAAHGLAPPTMGIAQSCTTFRAMRESYLFVTSFERVIYEATR
jgi:hypothetical protein